MLKTNKLLITLATLTSLIACSSPKTSIKHKSNSDETKLFCGFLKNYNKETITLSSGLTALANSLLYTFTYVSEGQLLDKPTDPEREGYDFLGWYKDSKCEEAWLFEKDIVTENMYLYASWNYKESSEFVEPEYVEPSKIDDSLSEIIEVRGILNSPLDNGNVKVSTVMQSRLVDSKLDCSSLLNYKMKSGTVIDECTFDSSSSVVSLSAHNGGETKQINIHVINAASEYIVDNATYESKAVAYEKKYKSEEDHHILLVGSSSMENWKTSSNDLLPMVTYNHGIGGTTVEQWSEDLNERLAYPYNPKTLVYYVGINNVINSHDDAATINNKLDVLFTKTHSRLPDTKIYYVLLNLIPGYMNYKTTIEAVNAHVWEFARQNSYIIPLDAGSSLLKENGEPNKAYFLSDGLHMSLYGYVLWGAVIKQALIDGMSNND